MSPPLPGTDHAPLIDGPLETGPDATRACLECHKDASRGDFNLFHLIDAKRFSFNDADISWLDNLPGATVHVALCNDERQAEEAWKSLRVMKYQNIYVLTGGINLWLDLCKPAPSGGCGG